MTTFLIGWFPLGAEQFLLPLVSLSVTSNSDNLPDWRPIGGGQFLLPLVSLSVSSNSALLPDWTMPIGEGAIPLTFAKSFCDIKQWQFYLPDWRPIGGGQFLLPLVSLSVSSNSALLPDWTMPIGEGAIPLTFAKSFCDIKQWQFYLPDWRPIGGGQFLLPLVSLSVSSNSALLPDWTMPIGEGAIPLTFAKSFCDIKQWQFYLPDWRPIGGGQFLLPLVSLSVSSNSALLPDWTMPIGEGAIPLTFAKSFCDIKQWQFYLPDWRPIGGGQFLLPLVSLSVSSNSALLPDWTMPIGEGAIPLTFGESVRVIK